MIAEAGFPPSSPPSILAIVLHLALLGLAILSVATLFLESRRPARPTDAFLWVVAVVLATGLSLWGAAESSHYRPFLIGYMLFVWAVSGVGGLMTSVRLVRQGQGQAVGCVVGSMLALGLLIGLLLPSVPSAREAARRMQCSNNLKQLGLAFWNWEDTHGRFPDAVTAAEEQPPRSWRVVLLPFLEAGRLHEQYDVSRSWDDPANLPVAQTPLPTLLCPSDPHHHDEQRRYFTAYVVVTGPETIYPEGQAIGSDAIDDGRANTLLLAEACGQNIVWTRPEDVHVRQNPVAVNVAGNTPTHSPSILSSYHSGGAHAALADGSVQFISESIDPQVLRALTTASGSDAARAD